MMAWVLLLCLCASSAVVIGPDMFAVKADRWFCVGDVAFLVNSSGKGVYQRSCVFSLKVFSEVIDCFSWFETFSQVAALCLGLFPGEVCFVDYVCEDVFT